MVQQQDKGMWVGVGVDMLWFKDGLFSQQRLKASVESLQTKLVPASYATEQNVRAQKIENSPQ